MVFDFDGTIGDTKSLIITCFQATYTELGLPIPEESAIASTIGLPLESAFDRLSAFGADESATAAAVYRRRFAQLDFRGVRPFAGMPEVVTGCRDRGIPVAVASSRNHRTLDPMLEALGIFDHLELVVDHDDAGTEKPDPEMLYLIARGLEIDPKELVMVGDTRYDIEMGKNAGSRTVAVTWGNHSPEELAALEPDLLARRPEEITRFLCGDRPAPVTPGA